MYWRPSTASCGGLMSNHFTQRGQELRRSATSRLVDAQQAVEQNGADAEAIARDALKLYASAMNWLEDTEDFDHAHGEMHAAGRWVRETFGCELHQDGDRYEQRCPVALSHKRLGVSPEIIVRFAKCSICGNDAQQCEHIAGRAYNGERCYRILENIEVVALTLVSRPAQPDARLLGYLPIAVEDLRQVLPSRWIPGMPVSCDRCLSPCPGVEPATLTHAEPTRVAVRE
jgi:hypothetical protein